MLKLNARAIPDVEYEAKLPEWLGPGGPCFIRFKAKAGGHVNPDYTAALQRVARAQAVAKIKYDRLTDPEEMVAAAEKNDIDAGRQYIAAVYDACVMSWETNILNDGKPMETDLANFMALSETKGIASIGMAIGGLITAIIKAGEDAAKADADTVKN